MPRTALDSTPPDLTGRLIVITGANSGLGLGLTERLAAAGAEIFMAVRNREKGERAAEGVRGRNPDANLRLLDCDLADLGSVRAAAQTLVDDGRAVDILINNAGVMACPLSYTAQDLEMQIGTNHFGHFLLSVLLARALMNGGEDGRSSRVVSLSSIGHRRSGIHFEDIHYRQRPYDKWEAYGQAKTANALFAVGFHERFADLGITANSVMPGGIRTPLQRHLTDEEMRAFGWIDEQGRVN